jgi:uncharacterized protein YkwD
MSRGVIAGAKWPVAAALGCLLLFAPVAASARPASVAKVESGIRRCANGSREAAGLEPLQASGVLDKAARLQARNMAVHGFFEHTDPQGRDPAARVAIFDSRHEFSFVGENIAAGYPSVQSTCRGWMNSSGHRANILDSDYTHIGAGFARGGPYGRYYVQVFARAQPSPRLP